MAVLAVWAVAWATGLDRRWWPVAVAVPFTPMALLPAWPVAVAAALTRRRLLAVAAGLVAAVHLVAVWPVLPVHGRPAAASGSRLRVVTANAKGRNVTPRKWAAAVLALHADVLLVQEYSNSNAKALDREGVAERYPWQVVSTWPFRARSATFSRFPLRDGATLPIGQSALAATVDVDGADVRVVNVHQDNPRFVRRWTSSFTDLERYLGEQSGAMVVGGDFNSTVYHHPFRDLLDGPLRDAHLDLRRGLATTWPAHRRVPPFALIDHVLVSDGVGVQGIEERAVPGSDHRAVVVELTLPAA